MLPDRRGRRRGIAFGRHCSAFLAGHSSIEILSLEKGGDRGIWRGFSGIETGMSRATETENCLTIRWIRAFLIYRYLAGKGDLLHGILEIRREFWNIGEIHRFGF